MFFVFYWALHAHVIIAVHGHGHWQHARICPSLILMLLYELGMVLSSILFIFARLSRSSRGFFFTSWSSTSRTRTHPMQKKRSEIYISNNIHLFVNLKDLQNLRVTFQFQKKFSGEALIIVQQITYQVKTQKRLEPRSDGDVVAVGC